MQMSKQCQDASDLTQNMEPSSSIQIEMAQSQQLKPQKLSQQVQVHQNKENSQSKSASNIIKFNQAIIEESADLQASHRDQILLSFKKYQKAMVSNDQDQTQAKGSIQSQQLKQNYANYKQHIEKQRLDFLIQENTQEEKTDADNLKGRSSLIEKNQIQHFSYYKEKLNQYEQRVQSKKLQQSIKYNAEYHEYQNESQFTPISDHILANQRIKQRLNPNKYSYNAEQLHSKPTFDQSQKLSKLRNNHSENSPKSIKEKKKIQREKNKAKQHQKIRKEKQKQSQQMLTSNIIFLKQIKSYHNPQSKYLPGLKNQWIQQSKWKQSNSNDSRVRNGFSGQKNSKQETTITQILKKRKSQKLKQLGFLNERQMAQLDIKSKVTHKKAYRNSVSVQLPRLQQNIKIRKKSTKQWILEKPNAFNLYSVSNGKKELFYNRLS